jgi:hypothetical protein
MPGMWWVVAVVAAVVLIATYLTWTASRVDRLHRRAAGAFAALDAQLVRRAEAAVSLAGTRSLSAGAGPPELYYAASAARIAGPEEREAAENDLTRQLRRHVGTIDEASVEVLVAVSRRVALARQVHTDVVRDALGVRRQLTVRLLRLARRHPQPAYFDIDDPALDPPRLPVPARAPGPTDRVPPVP